ncbi:MAG: glycosyltransferase family 117 protein [Candidatus Krumholzibacteriia bacterium]
MRGESMRRPGIWCTGALAALAVAVYARTLAPTTGYFDSGEFIAAAHTLGIPHQPGTPLYVLLGRCFDLLLFRLSTARAVNFMSALSGALGVLLACLIVVEIARRSGLGDGWPVRAGGLVGALFLLLSDAWWANSVEAEVYALSGCAVALLTWLALRWHAARRAAGSDALLHLILYLLGLGVGLHLGVLLAAPAVFALVLSARDRRLPAVDLLTVGGGVSLFLLSTQTRADTPLLVLLAGYAVFVVARARAGRPFALIGSAFFLLGLSVHLFMLIRAGLDPALNQGQPDNLAALLSCLRREQYPPLNPFVRQAPLGGQIAAYYQALLRQFTFLGDGGGALPRIAVVLGPLLLAATGLWHGVRRARPWIWLLVAGYLANADLLNLWLNFTSHEVRARDYFYSNGFLFAAILIGLGAAAVLRRLAGPGPETTRAPRAVAYAAAGLMLAAAALPLLVPGHPKWRRHDRSGDWIARDYAWNTLVTLDRDAILVTNADNDTFPLWYLQQVEEFRRDVTVFNLQLAELPWYVGQLRRRDPDLPLSLSDRRLGELAAQAGATGPPRDEGIGPVAAQVLRDIVATNDGRERPRPVYVSVTVPRQNVAPYFACLRAEGLAFRLTRDREPDGQPGIDAERTLRNLYGSYDYRSLLTGDSAARLRRFRPATAAAGDPDYAALAPLLGEARRDVLPYRDETKLPGNYTVAAARAGQEFLRRAGLPGVDAAQRALLAGKAVAALEVARRLEPDAPAVADLYARALAEAQRPR